MRIKKLTLFTLVLAAIMLQYSVDLVDSIMADRAIKLIGLAALIAFFKYHRPSAEVRKVLLLYGLLIGSAAFASLALSDVDGIVQAMKIGLAWLVLPLLLTVVPSGADPAETMIRLPVGWAALFSVQSLVLFALIYFEWPLSPRIVGLQRYGDMPELSYGVLGYANALNSIRSGGQILRAQSWFLEPSKFGGFLIYPTLVSFGYYLSTKRLRHLTAAVLCGAGLAITFSLAAVFGLLAGALALLLVRPARGERAKRGFGRYASGLAAVAALFLCMQAALSWMGGLAADREATRLTKVLARDQGTQHLLRDESRLGLARELLGSNALGVGLGGTAGVSELTSPNAFIYWAIAGGLPAILVMLLLYHRLLLSFCLPLLQSSTPHYRTVAAGFIGYTVQQLSYGTWVEPLYLFTVGIMILCALHDRRRGPAPAAAVPAPALL